jgi:hypothetical protein
VDKSVPSPWDDELVLCVLGEGALAPLEVPGAGQERVLRQESGTGPAPL